MSIIDIPRDIIKREELFKNYSSDRLLELKGKIDQRIITPHERNEFTQLLSFEQIRTYGNYVKSMDYPIPWQWFHHVVMEKIDNVIASPISRRVMIEMPPRHCKTLLAGQLLSTYLFGRFPNKSIVYATNVNSKAVDELSAMRKIITSDRYQSLFPGAKAKTSFEDISVIDKSLRKNKKDTANVLSNVYSDRGGLRTVGMGDILTGHPFHVGIADDLYKGYAEAQSEKVRENIWNWFMKVFCTRVDKMTIGGVSHIIVFFTRWHDDDICGRLQRIQKERSYEIEQFEKLGIPWYDWEILSFEAVKTEDKPSHPADPRKVGQPLWPLYEAEYHQQKILDPVGFESLYQQNPMNKYGQLFQRDYFQHYSTLPENITHIVVSIDPNLKEGKSNTTGVSDNFAILVMGLGRGGNIYLLDFVAHSKDYNFLKLETRRILRKYPHHWQVVIEQTAVGPALTSDLKISGFYRVTEFNPGSKSKFERASLIVPELISGKYFIPSRHMRPDIDNYVNQLVNFTGQKGRKDDLVDATVIGILYYMNHRTLADISYVTTMSNPLLARTLGQPQSFGLGRQLPPGKNRRTMEQ